MRRNVYITVQATICNVQQFLTSNQGELLLTEATIIPRKFGRWSPVKTLKRTKVQLQRAKVSHKAVIKAAIEAMKSLDVTVDRLEVSESIVESGIPGLYAHCVVQYCSSGENDGYIVRVTLTHSNTLQVPQPKRPWDSGHRRHGYA